MRSSVAAALLLAGVAGLAACRPQAALEAKNTTSHASAAVAGKQAMPQALYPVEARFASPGPFGSTEISEPARRPPVDRAAPRRLPRVRDRLAAVPASR
jgi:hypothetical protein